MIYFVLRYSMVSYGILRINPLESLRKFQMHLADNRMCYIVLSYAVLYCAKI
nr:MAG TPA: hypothetical protein [Caudoviricetes sp.]